MKQRRISYRRIKYGGGGIAPVYVDESQEEQGINEEVILMLYKKGATIDLTVPSVSDTISVYNTDN